MATFDLSNPTNSEGPGPEPGSNGPPLRGTVVPAGGAPAAPAGGVGRPFPSMTELLHGFRRCWLRALTLGILAAAVAAPAGWFGVPLSKARVRSLLYVAPERPSVAFPDPESRVDYNGYKKTQAGLVKSRLVLNAAVRQPEVASCKLLKDYADPAQWLEEHLLVDYSAGPELLTISLPGENPAELVPLVKAVTKVYLEEVVAKEHNQRFELLESLKDIESRYEERLKAKRKTLREVSEAAGANDASNVALKQRMALEQLAATQKELTQIRSEVRRLQIEGGYAFGAAKEKPAAPVPALENLVNEQLQKDLVVKDELAREAKLQEQLDEIKRVNPTHYEALTQKTRADLDAIHRVLEERRKRIRPQLEAQLREQAAGQAKAQSAQQHDQLVYLQKLEKQLTEDVDRLAADARNFNRQGLDLESVRKEISQADKIIDRIGLQAETLNVERNAPPRIRLIEEAAVSAPDPRIRQLLAAAAGGVGALALVLVGLSWWECRSLRINSADEVAKSLGIKVMGTLPMLPPARRRAGAVNWQGLLVESVDMMRTALLHVARAEGVRVVMVTSAVGGEGKTSLSSHLATSLARAGRSTLLIDCDLRKPSLHRVFELPRPEGMCELLRGELTPAQAVQADAATPGLSLIAGGGCDERALAVLAQGGLAKILAPLRDRYDFIIIDSSPVLPVVDALLIAQEVDGVLFSVLRDVSRLGRINAAHERLAMLGVRPLGAVVTGASGDLYYGADSAYLNKGSEAEGAAGAQEPSDDELVERNP